MEKQVNDLKFVADVKSVLRTSKTGNPYNVLCVDIKCVGCGVGVSIEDFGTAIPPMELKNFPITITKGDVGMYVINELNYRINYKYNMAVAILLSHNCENVKKNR